MLVSHAWLREWVSTTVDIRELAKRLTLGGLDVQSVATAGASLHKKRVIIGQITRCEPLPANSRGLKVCEVDIGRRSGLTIVCGAANAAVGGKVAVATVGAKLPMLEVQTRRIAGIESVGMLCSAAELGLEEHSDGIMLLHRDAPVGMSVGEYLDLSDPVLEIELTPNRGDCLSILGVAREVSALTGAKMRTPIKGLRPNTKIGQKTGPKTRPQTRPQTHPLGEACLPVDLQAPEGCPRYAGRAVRNIDMAARTPDWMKERLRRSGARSLNLVVDITNYVMLELGQPMHAFDLDKLAGGIVVRMAHNLEKLQLLDGNTVTLGSDNLVIADHKKAVALGGIMGGQNSAIGASTRHIYFEAAFFPAAAILGKARKFGLHTDASHRFERGVDPAMQVDAMERATQLLVSLGGGEPGPITDAREQKYLPRPAKINFSQSEIPRILGVSVPATRVSALMKRLGMQVAPTTAGWDVVVPGWRSDITGPHDLVEEVGRVYGFDKIAPRPPLATATTGGHPESRIEIAQIKQKLVERGYFEAITYSFVDPDVQQTLVGERGIKLSNPIADNMAVMRLSLWPGLLDAVKSNLNRQHERVRLFETGHVFPNSRTERRGKEIHRLAGVVTGSALPRQWGSSAGEVDFFDLKGDVAALLGLSAPGLSEHGSGIEFRPAEHPALHPGRSAQIRLGKNILGYLGQLHPGHRKRVDIDQPVYLFELNLSLLGSAPLPHFSPISRYPAMRRDLAVVVDAGVAARDVLAMARAAAGGLLINLELFDIYAGERIGKNQKSFAFRLTFQSQSRNLTAAEVDAKTDEIIDILQHQLGARLRA